MELPRLPPIALSGLERLGIGQPHFRLRRSFTAELLTPTLLSSDEELDSEDAVPKMLDRVHDLRSLCHLIHADSLGHEHSWLLMLIDDRVCICDSAFRLDQDFEIEYETCENMAPLRKCMDSDNCDLLDLLQIAAEDGDCLSAKFICNRLGSWLESNKPLDARVLFRTINDTFGEGGIEDNGFFLYEVVAPLVKYLTPESVLCITDNELCNRLVESGEYVDYLAERVDWYSATAIMFQFLDGGRRVGPISAQHQKGYEDELQTVHRYLYKASDRKCGLLIAAIANANDVTPSQAVVHLSTPWYMKHKRSWALAGCAVRMHQRRLAARFADQWLEHSPVYRPESYVARHLIPDIEAEFAGHAKKYQRLY